MLIVMMMMMIIALQRDNDDGDDITFLIGQHLFHRNTKHRRKIGDKNGYDITNTLLTDEDDCKCKH